MSTKALNRKFESNSISEISNLLFNLLFWAYCIACLAPLLLIFMVSITDEVSLVENGYSFIPNKISFKAYQYLFLDFGKIISAYAVTIGVCIVGSLSSIMLTMLYAYPISRKTFKYRKFFSFFIFFTMLFQGGLVPWYILYTRYLKLEDNLLALILPGLVSAFNVLIVRTYLTTNIPDSILEAARIDGAGEFRIFFSIIIPLSVPVIATIGLFSVLSYWNDWYNCLLFIRTPKYY
ncbi:MAG: carbohydrate ABC transporter permease, partial [Clostridiaceae bacterium]|nr:carbohydrate ABC transporter permease [Clostridiaceae bacterium]